MENIKSMLGLVVHNGCIMDMFDMDLVEFLEWMEKRIAKKLDSEEGVSAAEETVLLERRERIQDDKKDKVYGKALLLLAKIRPEYKKYLPKRSRKKKARGLSDLLKKRMCLAAWVGTGNKIPFRELNVAKVANLLGAKGYAYRRKKGEMGWYRDGLLVGKDLFDALGHLEGVETVDRSRLTIGF